MHRAIPISNKILSKKWEENNHRIHTEKLKNMQSRVNSGCPQEFFHLKYKAKRDQMLEDRFTEIERENRILLEKMSSIMNKKQQKDEGFAFKSLNKVARKEEMRRIAMDNKALLKRLQEKSPSYSIHQWEEDRRMKEKILKNMGDFPYNTSRNVSTPVSSKKPRKLSPIFKSIVYKKGVAIGDKHFLIEIHRNKKHLTIFTNDIEIPDSYSLQLPVEDAKELMGNTFNYDRLVAMLEMDNGEIVLVDPRDKEEHWPETVPAQKKNAQVNLVGKENFKSKKPRTNEVKVVKSYDFDADLKEIKKNMPKLPQKITTEEKKKVTENVDELGSNEAYHGQDDENYGEFEDFNVSEGDLPVEKEDSNYATNDFEDYKMEDDIKKKEEVGKKHTKDKAKFEEDSKLISQQDNNLEGKKKHEDTVYKSEDTINKPDDGNKKLQIFLKTPENSYKKLDEDKLFSQDFDYNSEEKQAEGIKSLQENLHKQDSNNQKFEDKIKKPEEKKKLKEKLKDLEESPLNLLEESIPEKFVKKQEEVKEVHNISKESENEIFPPKPEKKNKKDNVDDVKLTSSPKKIDGLDEHPHNPEELIEIKKNSLTEKTRKEFSLENLKHNIEYTNSPSKHKGVTSSPHRAGEITEISENNGENPENHSKKEEIKDIHEKNGSENLTLKIHDSIELHVDEHKADPEAKSKIIGIIHSPPVHPKNPSHEVHISTFSIPDSNEVPLEIHTNIEIKAENHKKNNNGVQPGFNIDLEVSSKSHDPKVHKNSHSDIEESIEIPITGVSKTKPCTLDESASPEKIVKENHPDSSIKNHHRKIIELSKEDI
ncbi:hypothetical protein SteCoe_36265 [Stentor coeruleus]|uniref:Uncharacterized protein n=1 Tax=Stentor coeruleus TaxID=5963 RepID=A0A1R2AQG4_9CILI|nr:hypothetical protein SteCoe_36265 [Stentor coeruleus]